MHFPHHFSRRIHAWQRPQVESKRPRGRTGPPADDRPLAHSVPTGAQIDLARRGRRVLAAHDRRRARHQQGEAQQSQAEDEVPGAFEPRRTGQGENSERRPTQERPRLDQGDDSGDEGEDCQPPRNASAAQRRHDERQSDHQKGGEEVMVPERHGGARGALAHLLDDRPDRGRGDDSAPGREPDLAPASGRPASGDERCEQQKGRQEAQADPARASHRRGPEAERHCREQGQHEPASGPTESQRIAPASGAQERSREHQPLPRRTGREGRATRKGAAPECEACEKERRQQWHRIAAF